MNSSWNFQTNNVHSIDENIDFSGLIDAGTINKQEFNKTYNVMQHFLE
jgi:hypothetical protein